MTDKGHEDMTASELLRSGDSICGLCMMPTDGDCMNHGRPDIFTTLANKIDAEIVKACSEKPNTCATVLSLRELRGLRRHPRAAPEGGPGNPRRQADAQTEDGAP